MNRILLLCLLILCFGKNAIAQFLSCNDTSHKFYYMPNYTVGGGPIYMYDPQLPLVMGINPFPTSVVLPFATGIAYGPNISGPGPSPTFYACTDQLTSDIYYYDGNSWINTGHSGPGFINPAAGGGYIYGMLPTGPGYVYRYDGTGNAVQILTLQGFGQYPVADLSVDCNGNFYLLFNAAPQRMEKYDPNGNLLITYSITGVPTTNTSGGGIMVKGDDVYFSNSIGQVYHGIIVGTVVNFSLLNNGFTPLSQDFAGCSSSVAVCTEDTVYYCGYGPPVKVFATGDGPFTWSVIAGNATFTTVNDSIFITATTPSTIIVHSAALQCGGDGTDTLHVVIPQADLDAGSPSDALGCNVFNDTLNASLNGTTPGVIYSISWSPAGSITAGGNTLSPSITQVGNTTYFITVSTPPGQGGCLWTDSVLINSIEQVFHSSDSVSICSDSVLIFGNQQITNTGVYTETFQSVDDCDSIATLSVLVIDPPQPFNLQLNDICLNKTLNISVANQPGYHFNWFFDSASVVHNGGQSFTLSWTDTGTRTIMGLVSNDCGVFQVIDSLVVNPLPEVAIEINSIGLPCAGDTFYFAATNGGYTDYLWYLPQGTVKTGASIEAIAQSGIVVLTVADVFGCSSSDSTFVNVDACCLPALPDAFTPNNDGKNDIFRLISSGGHEVELFRIANRFGEVVFETQSLSVGWDGKYKGRRADVGTYFYIVRYKCFNGEKRETKGDVTLIR